MEYGSRKTEISAASCSHCIVLSHTARRAHAGASWFSQNHQRQRNPQLEELARTLARQVTLNIAPLMRSETPDENRINAVLRQLTQESRILDAGVYDEQGDLITRAGESVNVRDRLALDGKKAGSYFNQQIVEPIQGKNGPLATCV
ncbi:membrane protein [Salmonella enterica subsp. enterica]|uniref:Membrane protein n=1 Tax=Salmonella enterica I TaxID=59201 RepID=A0A3S4F9Z9_SALET|nr:membrane protein [Salmonella enterica subsp. enterica]